MEQALNALDRRDVELADLAARPISYVGQFFAASKGVRDVEPETFNPFERSLYLQYAKDVLDPIAAQLFLKLTQQKKIPSWAIGTVDLKLIRAAAS